MDDGKTGVRTLAVRFALAAVPYLVWKLLFGLLYGVANTAYVFMSVAAALLAACLLFLAGLGAGSLAERPRKPPAVSTAVAIGAVIGFAADFFSGIGAAAWLARLAGRLGDAGTDSILTSRGAGNLLLFMIFSLGGALAGALAGFFYARAAIRNRGEASTEDSQ